MSKSNIMRIILVVGIALIIIGILLLGWVWATADDRNVIRVQLEGGNSEALKFEELALVPGEECEYLIKLERMSSDSYDLVLDFVESGEGTLADYARVRITSGEHTVCDELLRDAFSSEDIVLSVDFSENKNTELKVIYYLPVEVGNEAKNAEAIFELLLTASNE